MTSLHYLLIALGIAFIAAVALYNHLVERRYRKQAEKIFAQKRQDVSLGGAPEMETLNATRIEPRFGLGDSDTIASTDDGNAAAMPAVDAPPSWAQAETELATAATGVAARPAATPPSVVAAQRPAEAEAVVPVHRPESASPLDPATEYIARVRYAQPTAVVFAALLDDLRRISKPVRVFGHLDGGEWIAVTPHGGQTFDSVEFSLLLDDRGGPVSEVQLDTFCQALYEFASEHGGAVSCPDKPTALERARELDAFCAEVDVLIGINVVASDHAPFSGEDIHRIATEAGLRLGSDGAYVSQDSQGRLLFSLMNQGDAPFPPTGSGLTSHGISLIFDVPRVADGMAVFDRMTRLGFDLAERLGGRLVGDGGYPVDAGTLEKDRQRLTQYYARMKAKGLDAGGERALRVFA